MFLIKTRNFVAFRLNIWIYSHKCTIQCHLILFDYDWTWFQYTLLVQNNRKLDDHFEHRMKLQLSRIYTLRIKTAATMVISSFFVFCCILFLLFYPYSFQFTSWDKTSHSQSTDIPSVKHSVNIKKNLSLKLYNFQSYFNHTYAHRNIWI